MEPKNLISCIIPAHNEAETIGDVVLGLSRALPKPFEVIVVDDGSQDETAEAARAAGAKVLRHPKKMGKGAAVRSGIIAAKGEIVLLIDADGQDDPSEAPKLLGALKRDVAMVLGSRFLGRFEVGSVTLVHWVGNKALTALFNLLFHQRLSDAMAGFRAFWRDAIDPFAIRANGFEIEADMDALVAQRGGRIVEVPVTRKARKVGRSRFSTIRDGLRIALWLFRRWVGGFKGRRE